MGSLKGFAHTFGTVLLVLIVYNVLVKQFTPTPIQSWIGVGASS